MVIATEQDIAGKCPGCGADAARRDRGALPAMTPLHSHCLNLDLHRLDLRFAASRLVEPHAVARLAESIERCGQIVPCIVVAIPGGEDGGAEALVLIDGYRRVAALRRLGRDTAGVEQWSCDLTQALLGVLARAQDRPFASIEQALLLRALMAEQGLSQHDVAQRCGRDVSWVSRRLQLLSGLPDAALAAVRGGRLSSWGSLTQRYVKRHCPAWESSEISHLCGFSLPHLSLRFRDGFWGWNADRIPELFIGEVVFPEQVNMFP
jgi:hypothetical protein